ncbi:MAG: ABC transporter ATP-binding protein [Simkaniaceae bacterium]|nr:ABC transporter ATP-binding protein [Simkaniaceae bacterium]
MIKVDELSFAYAKALILQNATLEIATNSFTAIIGPNGGGKTTFLKLLMGILSPTSGSITIEGAPPANFVPQMSYVPQMRSFDRDFPISVFELVMMGALSELTLFGRYPQEAKERAYAALERVDLTKQADQPFGSLSGGQAQRALIARALVSDPKILLLDEPTASVDPIAQENIQKIIQQLHGKLTILMVTHELQSITKDVDEVLYINKELKRFPPSKVCGHFAMGLYHEEAPC